MINNNIIIHTSQGEYLKSHNFNTGFWYTPEREIYDYD